MQVSEQVAAGVSLFGSGSTLGAASLSSIRAHLLLVGLVQAHHAPTSEMEGKGGGEQCEETDLDSGVVENLGLGGLVLGVAVLKLATDSSVTGGDGDTTGQHSSSLHDNGATDPGKGAVDERW